MAMRVLKLGVFLYGISMVLSSNTVSLAQINVFTEHKWNAGAGSLDWQVNGNWDLGVFPNDTDSMDGIYPTANLSGAYGSNLTVNVGTTGVTIAGLTLGGTSSVVTTEVSSGGPAGILKFRNDDDRVLDPDTVGDSDFDNDGDVDGGDFLNWARGFGTVNVTPDYDKGIGDADKSFDVDNLDLGIYQTQFGFGTGKFTENSAFIDSVGVAGSVNRITSPVLIENESLEIYPENPLVFDTGADISATSDTVSSNISALAGADVTINSNIIVTDSTQGIDLRINQTGKTRGTIVINGQIQMANAATPGNISIGGGDGTVELYGNNDFTGDVFVGDGTTGDSIILGHNNALGVSSVDPNDTARVRTIGSTLYSDNDARTIPNDFLLGGFLRVAGSNSIDFSGLITQTNNVGTINDLDSGKTLTLSGTIAIWGDSDTDPDRDFAFDGTGKTVVTGEIISWDPQVIIDDPSATPPDYSGLIKRGSGVVIIDVDSGDNNHTGDTIVEGGNLHYADNDALNAGSGLIVSRSGAVGVDTGVASNSTFMSKIDPVSFGGLMIPSSESSATLDFTTTLANAGNMTVAAPETGMTFTGTIIPANSTYGLGGGEGVLTLPNATLTGANNLEVRNGSTVVLTGANTYTGYTLIADGAPTLVVDDLANGGVASSIGAATSDATNLVIHGSTLQYVGSGDTTDRLFSVGTAGATLDSSGTGAVVFNNVGTILMNDAADLVGDIDDFTANNPPDRVYNIVGNTRDVIAGMTISDPDPDFVFGAPNSCGAGNADPCIPAGTTVTGVSSDRSTIFLDMTYPFVQKLSTRLVFGPVPRDLILDGTNTDDNEIAGVIGDSSGGSVVSVVKNGSGKWILSGANTYTGNTVINEGELSITSAFLDDASTISIEAAAGAILNLDFVGTDTIAELIIDGEVMPAGVYTSSTDGITGSGSLTVPVLAAALAAVPEPSSLLLISMACVSLAGRRNRK